MNKTITYKDSTALAIQAMMSAARKDEYADRKKGNSFPQNRKKRDVTLKDVREWNKRRNWFMYSIPINIGMGHYHS